MRLLQRPPSYSSDQPDSETAALEAVKLETAPQYQANECTHDAKAPTPALKAHLQAPSTQACLSDLRDILSSLIDDTKEPSAKSPCLKCAAAATLSTLFTYAGEMRDAKRSGGMSKTEVKALKKEFKSVIKGLKREHWPAMKKNWKQKP